jgi:hypothetical protein
MKKLFRLIVLVLLVAGWSLAALSLHVVRGQDKIVVIPKQTIDWVHGWRETYVDTRNWTLDDVANHPAVVNRLIQNGKADVLQHVAPQATGTALPAELQAAIERGPQPKTVTAPATQPVEHSVV